MAEGSRFTFAGYVLDGENEQLLVDHQPLRLTNKALAVLRYLIEHAGQLVTKDALLTAVWPKTVVSETALTNCIGELRRALGDDPKQPRFIETVPRRGYRFIAEVVSRQEEESQKSKVKNQKSKIKNRRCLSSPKHSTPRPSSRGKRRRTRTAAQAVRQSAHRRAAGGVCDW